MSLQEHIKMGQVKKASPDISLIKSLQETAESDRRFLKGIELKNDSARKLMTNYYDILRSILEAIASLNGYKIYSHEAFTSFLKEKKEDHMAEKFDRFRRIRNGIAYYGKNISVEEAKELIKEIKALTEELENKYLKE